MATSRSPRTARGDRVPYEEEYEVAGPRDPPAPVPRREDFVELSRLGRGSFGQVGTLHHTYSSNLYFNSTSVILYFHLVFESNSLIFASMLNYLNINVLTQILIHGPFHWAYSSRTAYIQI